MADPIEMLRVPYRTIAPGHGELDSLPWLPITLSLGGHSVQALGLVDSGATINVLPFALGSELGALWENEKATIQLAGNLGSYPAMPLVVEATVEPFAPVTLVFAWTRSDRTPLILGQTNFLHQFEVCCYRAHAEFRVRIHTGSTL